MFIPRKNRKDTSTAAKQFANYLFGVEKRPFQLSTLPSSDEEVLGATMNPTSDSTKSNSTRRQMEEFQKVLTMAARVTSSATSPTPSASASTSSSITPREVLVRSPEDGYLHPEVGIDEELERLLNEHPGLYMDDDKTMASTPSPPVIKR